MKLRSAKPDIPQLILIGAVLLIIIAGVVISLRRPDTPPLSEGGETGIESGEMIDEEAYRSIAQQSYNRLSDETNRQAATTKEDLLALTVDKSLKDLHLRLVMASAAFEEYESFNDPSVRAQAEAMLEDLARDYPWLNE